MNNSRGTFSSLREATCTSDALAVSEKYIGWSESQRVQIELTIADSYELASRGGRDRPTERMPIDSQDLRSCTSILLTASAKRQQGVLTLIHLIAEQGKDCCETRSGKTVGRQSRCL